jgi:sugar lactone lactonase YvrE
MRRGHGRGGSNGSANVYAPTDDKLIRVITTGVADARAIAFDQLGNLYVANEGPHPPGSVAVYAPGAASPSRSITNGVDEPSSLAVDNSGNLYVANTGSHEVTIYNSQQSVPIATISVDLNSAFHVLQMGP